VVKVFGIVALLLGSFFVWTTVSAPISFAVKVVYVLPPLVSAVVLYIILFRPSITLTDSELVICNFWRKHRIAVGDIESVDAGYRGITVAARDGRVLRGWAAQKPNLYRWMGWRSRADNIAEEIRQQIGAKGSI
jgi:hypothetical protein